MKAFPLRGRWPAKGGSDEVFAQYGFAEVL